ncbi:hypothetical protein GOP47_0026285 [Adiantum capillus-veneris]|nr:hypothetical protein GOP47_0026285 [Adiantum capillus-veneris]
MSTLGPRGTVGARRRRVGGSGGGSGAVGNGNANGANMLRFYTDDAPGFKMNPTFVIGMSVCFIEFVPLLHAVGKIYDSRST